MKLQFNYPQLAAEFFIVFFGVAVALAADQWRQGLQDNSLEHSYLERLVVDLRLGRERVAAVDERFKRVIASTSQLIQILESGDDLEDSNHIFELASRAAQTGFNRNDLTYSATFDELIATGNLSLIQSTELRTAIVNHFREASAFVEEVEELPLNFNRSFKAIIGHSPSEFVRGVIESSPELQARLILELENDGRLLDELRLFQGEIVRGEIFQDNIDGIDELLALIESNIGPRA